VTVILALLGTPLVSAPVAPWLSPGVAVGFILVLTVCGFVLGATVWRRRIAIQ